MGCTPGIILECPVPALTPVRSLCWPMTSALTKIASFYLNAECCFVNRHKTHSYYHLVTAEPPFIRTSISRMHRTKPRKRVQHAIVCYHTLIVYQVCRDVDRCVKSESCSLSSASSETSMACSIGGISYNLNKC